MKKDTKDQSEGCFEAASKNMLERMHRYTTIAKWLAGYSVLDIGCRTGDGTYILSNYVSHAVGIESDFSCVEQARYTFHKENLEYFYAPDMAFDFPEHSFDAVLFFEFAHYFYKENISDILKEIYKILSSNGKFIIALPGNMNTEPFVATLKLANYFPYCISYFQKTAISSFIYSNSDNICQLYNKDDILKSSHFRIDIFSKTPVAKIPGLDSAIISCESSDSNINQALDNQNVLLQKLEQQIAFLSTHLTTLEKKEQVYKKIDNIQHTVNDLLYVSQNTVWYKKAMRRIAKGSSLTGKFIKQNISSFYHQILGQIFNKSYRLAQKSSHMYNFLKRLYSWIIKLSPDVHKRMDHAIWNTKNEVDQIPPQREDGITNEVEQCDEPIHYNDPFVTVIVPNYNHALYLRERLDSIYNQTYQNFEVILLDDCSTDNSREILSEYAARYPDRTRCDFNKENIGHANLQWDKGIRQAKGKYIWIAESDDWCELDFLEKLLPKMEQQSVMIAFARSVFMTEGKKTWSTEEYLHDMPFKWDKPFTMTGYEAVQKGFAIKNFIPNVSSAIFRNIGELPEEVMNIWKDIRLCGDWIFYLYLVKGGAFSYTNETTNYYRIHPASTSLKIQKTSEYYQESEIVSCYIARNYKINMSVFERTLQTLQNHYLSHHTGANPEDVSKWYRLDVIHEASRQRIPNILLCNFSMKIGGGEILPIHLANSLRKMGVPITFLDCRMEEYDEKVRGMLDPSVPLIELRTPLALRIAAKVFGIEVVHSHHGNVDKLVSELLRDGGYKQIITLHGMYEAIETSDLISLLDNVTQTCDTFAYIAEKNLEPFKEYGYYNHCHFVKVANGLVPGCPAPVPRSAFQVPDDAFLLCLVSRARFDKGWLEAVQAVILANKSSKRPIHLVMVGDGEAYKKVCEIESPYIHTVGARSNPRAYFAASDMGFLPSRFSGESFPLTVIESLMCGKPVLATNIGEIENQITLPDGRQAGVLFSLQEGKIPVEKVSQIICELASDPQKYYMLQSYTKEAAERFDIKNVAEKYIEIYRSAIHNQRKQK